MRLFTRKAAPAEARIRTRPWDGRPAPRSAFLRAEFQELLPVHLNFNDCWELVGLRFTEWNRCLALAMQWRCRQRVFCRLRCFAHVLDTDGHHIFWMDHDPLDGNPPVAEWMPGDEGYEVQYLDLHSVRREQFQAFPGTDGRGVSTVLFGTGPFHVRLGVFNPNTNLRLPLVASTLPGADDYSAAVISANAVPGTDYRFRFDLAPPAPCRVMFGEAVELVEYSLTRCDGGVWVRLGWNVRGNPDAPLRFFGHAVPGRHPKVGALRSFDQEMAIEHRGPAPCFQQDIVRSLPSAGPQATFLRAGVCTSRELLRLPILESDLDWDAEHRCLYLAIPCERSLSEGSEPTMPGCLR